MPSEIDRLLGRVLAPSIEPPEPTRAGEDAALAEWAARHERSARPNGGQAPEGWRAWLLGRVHPPRFAIALAGVLLAIVGACVLPTSYEIPLGLSVELSSEAELPHEAIARFVRERSGASEVEVFVRRFEPDSPDEGPARTQMQIRLWDQELAVGELEAELREAFAAELRAVEIVETPLEGEVETIWARRIAHRTFDLALREADVEQARAHLLLQLHAQGLSDDEIVVEVRDRPDGHREIRIEIERDSIGDDLPELPLP